MPGLPDNEDLLPIYLPDIADQTDIRKIYHAFVSYQNAVNSGSIVSITDIRGIILYANKLFCECSKYTREELIGQNHRIINSGYHPKEYFIQLWKTILAGKIWRGEIRNRAKDGTYYWVDSVISPIFNDQGNIERFLSVRNLITGKKKIEKALERTNTLLNETQQLAKMGSWELNLTSNLLWWSEETYRIFEKNPGEAEITLQDFWNLVHPEDLELVISAYHNSVENHAPYTIDHRLLFPDGNIKYVREFGKTMYDSKGEPVRSIGSVQDITRAKETEDRLHKNEQRYEQVVENIGDALMIDDVDGRVVYANKQYLELFGLEERDLHTLVLEDYVAPEYHELLRVRHNARVRGEDVPELFEYEGVKKDGSRRWLQVRVSKVLDQGKITGTQSAIRDITDSKIAEKTLEAQNEELKKTNAELDRFVYRTSHDLRAPLLGVLGLIDLCKELYPDDGDLNDLLFRMTSTVNRLDDTIKSILDYARNSRLEPSPERLDVRRLIQDYFESIRHFHSESEIHFSLEVDETVPFYSDRLRVTTILHNLINNAVKYQRKEEPDKQVKVEFHSTEKEGALLVTDNGEGIPEPMSDKIFEMFIRNSTQSVGSGLGLYMCKEMVNKLHGRIEVSSRPGAGSVFTVHLPNHQALYDKK